jgi:MFS family permease
MIRLFCFGSLAVVLALYLAEAGLEPKEIGLLLTLTLIGDAAISLWMTTSADRFGRRRTLILGSFLMLIAGGVLALTSNPVFLFTAAIIGVVSPSGNEIGPFLSIEQAALAQLSDERHRTRLFAWYNLVGSISMAAGSLCGGWIADALQHQELSPLESYRLILAGYSGGALILTILFLCLSDRIEPMTTAESTTRTLGLFGSKPIVMKLSGLFMLDAFAGGFVMQSIVAYWLHLRFGIDDRDLGSIFFGANILAGVSALAAARIASRFGLVNTMVFTHIPSNIILCLVPLMPGAGTAIAVLLLRFSISQMDVPTRQSYTMAVVAPDERSAASGITSIARSLGAMPSPSLCGLLLANPALWSMPFFLAGGLKIAYDLLLYFNFRKLRAPEERPSPTPHES